MQQADGAVCTVLQSYANQAVRCWSGNDDEAHDGRHHFDAQVSLHICLCSTDLVSSTCSRSNTAKAADDVRAALQGVISVTSNVIPGVFSALMQNPNPELASSVADLVAWLFAEPNPIPVNTALAMCGAIRPVFRLPYVPLDRRQREVGAVLLQRVAEHLPGPARVQTLKDSDFRILGHY